MDLSELTKMGVAVPGSLGVILAIATFAFMAWLVKYVMVKNQLREELYLGLMQKELAQQQAALGRIEKAGDMQRQEHQTIVLNQEKSLARQESLAQILSSLVAMLNNGNSHMPSKSR